MACHSARQGSSFRVEGDALPRRHSMYVDGSDGLASEVGAASNCATSGDQSSERGSEIQSEAGGSASGDMMSQVIAVNKALVQQIDALRLRLEIDYKHNQEQKAVIDKETTSKIKTRNKEMSKLKSELQEKSDTLNQLTGDDDERSSQLEELQRQIEELRGDVEDAKIYADVLESEMSTLKKDKGKLQTGSAYQEKDEEIKGLNREIEFLRKNLSRMEKELTKAKEVISQHGSKIRLMDKQNKNIQMRLREELNKVSQNMRLEVGKMRDVMRNQWCEMKELREQNETMSSDLKQIREMLVEQNKNRSKATEVKTQPTGKTSHGHMISMAFKPSPPVLVKEKTRSSLQSKKV